MKWIALLLVIAGTGLAAAMGARNTDDLMERQRIAGRAELLTAVQKKAHAAYCESREENNLPLADGCPDKKKKKAPKKEKKEAEAPKEEPPPPSLADLVAKAQAELDGYRASEEALPAKTGELREAWLKAFEAAIGPGAEAAVDRAVKGKPAGERLGTWFDLAGLPFLGGLALIIMGGLLGRKAARDEAEREGSEGGQDAKGEQRGPVDFGVMLGELEAAVNEIAADMEAHDEPTPVDHERVKGEIEELQLEKVEQLVEARMRLQLRYGVGGFAQVFGPFSAGERNLNRAWSAVVDHHWPEASDAIKLAGIYFKEAHEELNKLAAAHK